MGLSTNNCYRFVTVCIICKICGFHGGDYEEWCLLGCYAVWLLWFLQEPHGVTTQKRPFFVCIIIRTIIHRPVFYLKTVHFGQSISSPTSGSTQLVGPNRWSPCFRRGYHLKTETESSLRNVALTKGQDGGYSPVIRVTQRTIFATMSVKL
jgi:hypothetical protein